jgi:hypothetical protein
MRKNNRASETTTAWVKPRTQKDTQLINKRLQGVKFMEQAERVHLSNVCWKAGAIFFAVALAPTCQMF